MIPPLNGEHYEPDTFVVEQDRPLPFEDRCIIRKHRVGALATHPIEFFPVRGRVVLRKRRLERGWCVDMIAATVTPTLSRKPSAAVKAASTRKRRRKLREDGRVVKRCRHPRADWDLCGCPFYYYVTHEGRKHRGKIPEVTTMEQARTAYTLIAARIRNGQPAIERKASDGLTVQQLGDEWLSLPRDRKASAIRAYRDNLRAHVYPALGSKLVSEVTAEDCERFVLKLKPVKRDAPLSVNSKQRIAVTVQALFTFAVERRKRLDNPARGLAAMVRDPDASPDDDVIDPKDHTRYFTADEAAHLLRVVEQKVPQWHVFVLTGLQTGMRMGELAALRYSDINWRGGYLTVRSNWVQGRFTSPKNGKSRTVSLSRRLRALLRLRWREHRDSTRLVFPSREGTPIDVKNFRRRAVQEIIDAAELDYRTPHAMRHTHTSLLLQAGESPVKVAAEAGRSLQETMRTYAHFLPGGNRESADTLDGLLTGKDAKTHVSSKRGSNGNERPRTATNLRAVKGNS